MATSKHYKAYVEEFLHGLGEISFRPMMGEYLFYYKNVLVGGIYDEQILLKRTLKNAKFGLAEVIPYSGAKAMYLLDSEDLDLISKIIQETYDDLKK